MQPRDKDKLQKPIFNYSNTKPLPKLTVKRNDNAKPQPQPNSIIVPNESSAVQLSFKIKGTINGEEHVFVSNIQGDNPKLLTPANNAPPLSKSSLQQFTLYRKGNPAEKLVFDVRFKVEKES